MRVIHFPTHFVENPSGSNERQRDSEIGEKLVKRATAFIAILIEFNRRFKGEGLQESDLVAAATQKYQSANDIVKEFCEECTIEDEGRVLRWKITYPAFVTWATRRKRIIPNTVIRCRELFDKFFGVKVDNKYDDLLKKAPYGWKGRYLRE